MGAVTTKLESGHSTVRRVAAQEFLSLMAKDIDGNQFDFSQLKNKVTLITNVASKCGATERNYKELRELNDRLKGENFQTLAFPCNQFGKQEPGSPEQIKDFAAKRSANFTMMEKIDVNGQNTHPVYKLLKGDNGSDIRWNFATKFLVQCTADTCILQRHDGSPDPLSLESEVRKLVAKLGKS